MTSDRESFFLIDRNGARYKTRPVPEVQIGTPLYMSIRVLEGGRKSSPHPPPTGSIDWFLLTLVHVVSAGDEQDDLESLLSTMVYLLYGNLPWSPEKPATHAQTLSRRYEAIFPCTALVCLLPGYVSAFS